MEENLEWLVLVDIPVEEREARVQDYWNEEKGWDEYLFQGILPDVVLDRLMAFTLSTEKDVHDELLWAPESSGVSSVNIDEAKNQLVVIGVGVDSFELIKCLKKKFKCASIVSIEEVKPPPPAQQKDGGKKEGDKKEGDKKDGEKKDGDKKDGEKKKGDDCCKPCPCPPPNPCVQYYPVLEIKDHRSESSKEKLSLPVNEDKCRAKAMKIAVSTAGVISADMDPVKNQLVVTGEGVDFFVLMKGLKRKFRCATIIAIEEVKPPPAKTPPKTPPKKCCKPCPCPCPPPSYSNSCVIPVYDPSPQNCTIL
nr:heavy metal-associated isoprenylated plant protein 47-like [Ipomoea batatas]